MTPEERTAIMSRVYAALRERGYSPINQLCGYLLTGDPTYITNYGEARALINSIEREALLCDMVKGYLLDEHAVNHDEDSATA